MNTEVKLDELVTNLGFYVRFDVFNTFDAKEEIFWYDIKWLEALPNKTLNYE